MKKKEKKEKKKQNSAISEDPLGLYKL